MSHAIAMEKVTKRFGSHTAVENLDLVIPQGSLHGLIGPNGAGKTTTIRMIMSIIFADSGSVRVLGKGSATEAKDRIGYLPEERGVYRKMKVAAFLTYMARLKGCDGGAPLRKKVDSWLERVALGASRDKRCEELSKGMQQKVQFLSTIMHEPDLLILDEPFSGLDPVNMRLMRDLFLEQHQAGRTIVFSTHVMHQAEQMCDRIVMIHRGKKVLDGPLAQIHAQHEPDTLRFEPLSEADASLLDQIPGVASVETHGKLFEIRPKPGVELPDLMQRVVARVPAKRAELKYPTLEDIFIEIVGNDAASAQIEAQRAAEEFA